MNRRAIISPCGTYRFTLSREETPLFRSIRSNGTVLFVLNNPSKADAKIDDPTVRRGWAFTRAWDYHRMIFANVNPYRSTDPKSALIPPENILAENDTHLRFAAAEADLIICAWGTKANPQLAARAFRVLYLQKPLHVIELSKDGIPKHPLYLKRDMQPIRWRVEKSR